MFFTKRHSNAMSNGYFLPFIIPFLFKTQVSERKSAKQPLQAAGHRSYPINIAKKEAVLLAPLLYGSSVKNSQYRTGINCLCKRVFFLAGIFTV